MSTPVTQGFIIFQLSLENKLYVQAVSLGIAFILTAILPLQKIFQTFDKSLSIYENNKNW